MGKRICALCGKPISGYPHVTIWEEAQRESRGLRFHTMKEAMLYLVNRLGFRINLEAEG
jgi:hypothetical protein